MQKSLTTAEAARFLKVSPERVRELIRQKRLSAEKCGRDWVIQKSALNLFAEHGRKQVGRPSLLNTLGDTARRENAIRPQGIRAVHTVGDGMIYRGDALDILPHLPSSHYQAILADPPYFQVLRNERWDNAWQSPEEYLEWTVTWVRQAKRVLKNDGLLLIFGQLGKREHIWLHTCSLLAQEMQFHDMIIWDRAVGYNERRDSFTPQYEMILVLRQSSDAKPYFNKEAVRLPYSVERIQIYQQDKRYKDTRARARHLSMGKYATNILRVPSLKGVSKEKAGHPSQKPVQLIQHLISASTRVGDAVLDPFLGSGTTAVVAQSLGRRWTGIELQAQYVRTARKRLAESS